MRLRVPPKQTDEYRCVPALHQFGYGICLLDDKPLFSFAGPHPLHPRGASSVVHPLLRGQFVLPWFRWL